MTDTATSIVSAAVKGDLSHKITQAGAAGTVIFGLTLNDWGMIIGIVLAIGGYIMNWYYRRKEYRLKKLYYAKHGVKDPDTTQGEIP